MSFEENDLNEPGRKRILFVDDEPNMLAGLRRMLHSMRKEWEMVFVPGGDEALQALKLEPFDIVVTDMRMPGTNGAELLAEIVRLYPEMVRIVLSGQWDEEMAIQSAKTAHQYLTKPCSADCLRETLASIFALRRRLCSRSLKRLASGLTVLPSLPDPYRQLLQAAEMPGSGPDAIGAIVSSDLAMTAKVLQLANAGFFGVSRQVSSPNEAVACLGVDMIKRLVQTLGVFSQFRGDEAAAQLLEDVRRHSIDTGRIARAISRAEGVSKRMLDDAFVASLLHDLGRFILITKDAEIYETALAIARASKTGIEAVEREAFGASHSEVGSYLLWLWGLPENVTEAVACHHRPSACAARPEMSAVLLVHVADVFALELRGSHCEHQLGDPPTLDESYLAAAGFAGRVREWRRLAHEEIEVSETP